MQQPERLGLFVGQRFPVGAQRFEHAKAADDIGLHEFLGPLDAAVHMGFGGKVEHGARLVLGQQTLPQCAVRNIALHQNVPCIALQ